MAQFDPTVWTLENRDALIQMFVDQGKSLEQATVMVDSALVAAGEMTVEQANAGGSQTVTRIQAPWSDPNDPATDPSPDSYKDAQAQNANDYK